VFRISRKAVDAHAFLFACGDCFGRIADSEYRHPKRHAGRGFRGGGSYWRLPFFGQKNGGRAERGGGADNSAGIVRILYPAEKNEKRVGFRLKRRYEILKRLRQLFESHARNNPLVRSVAFNVGTHFPHIEPFDFYTGRERRSAYFL
jgi:hypothetical protein